MVTIKNTNKLKATGITLCLLGASINNPVQAGPEDWDMNVSGYLRATTGLKMNDDPETLSDDSWELNMARGTFLLDFDIFTGPLTWKLVTRFDKEHKTDYLENLEDLVIAQSPGGRSTRNHFLDAYQTDHLQEFFREYYVDFSPFDGLDMRVGKQQLVWGESDFFQAMDQVHGFDYRWRLFYENNEEWRKPLFLVNFNLSVPKFDGNLNFYVRPGLDREDDIGSNYNIEGGRWIPTPYRGVDFTAFTSYNGGHSEGDYQDPTYGIRWNGIAGSTGYSFAYLKTFNPLPIMNPAVNSAVPGLFGVTSMRQYGDLAGNQVLGDWVFPEIDIFGASVNHYLSGIDSTVSAEVAFIPDKPFNFGNLSSSLPGWGGVIEKDTMIIMARLDKELRSTMDWLGTNRPSLSSIQVFDTWILDHDPKDEIVEFASFAAPKREHTIYMTLFTLLNYKRDTINPSFVIGRDMTNGGGFAIPAVEFVIGDDWRFKAEADLFWTENDEKVPSARVPGSTVGAHLNPLGVSENNAALFDWFANDNQLVFKLTRLF